MTAYELLNKVYKHYYGQFLQHSWHSSVGIDNLQEYIAKAFDELLFECSVEWTADSTRIVLIYDDPANKDMNNSRLLQGIEVQKGCYLCYYNGHDDM